MISLKTFLTKTNSLPGAPSKREVTLYISLLGGKSPLKFWAFLVIERDGSTLVGFIKKPFGASP
jgi:hypothetical protein